MARTLAAALLIVGALQPSLAVAGARSAARIKADYSRVQQALAQGGDGKSWNRDDPESRVLLEKAWALMGEWATTYLRMNPNATSEALAAAMGELNTGAPRPPSRGGVGEPRVPSESAIFRNGGWLFGLFAEGDEMDAFFQEIESYQVSARAIRLKAGGVPPYAIAVSYGYQGRLLVVSTAGTRASVEIHRGGTFFPLPRTATGHDRFYVDANPNDWPTSNCGGGQLSIWEWDGTRAIPIVIRSYGYPRSDERHTWGVHRRGRWLKVYTRDELETMGECCSCVDLKAVRKIRIGPDRVEELGIQYVVPEFPLIDDLLDRAMRGIDASDIAAPEVSRNLAEVFRILSVTPLDPRLALLISWRAERTERETVFTLSADYIKVEFVFRITSREGRPFIAEMTRPQPKAAAFLAAVRARLKEMEGEVPPLPRWGMSERELEQARWDYVQSVWTFENKRAAAELVTLEHPELLPDEEDFERVRYCLGLWPCGLLPTVGDPPR